MRNMKSRSRARTFRKKFVVASRPPAEEEKKTPLFVAAPQNMDGILLCECRQFKNDFNLLSEKLLKSTINLTPTLKTRIE